MKGSVAPEQIDQLLPQTQCGLCGFNGCLPYAQALAAGEATINLCPPGGVTTLKALGNLLTQDPTPYIDEMTVKAKPPTVAVIREAECIGCTKCIKACPVDAIVGGAKLMHTVISQDCSGCDLCVPACPVDCIDMVTLFTESTVQERAALYRERYTAREQRLAQEEFLRLEAESLAQKKSYLKAAIARAAAKKQQTA